MKSFLRMVLVLLLVVAMVGVFGCKRKENKANRKMRRNLNPDMATPVNHWQQYLNNAAVARHFNLRQVPDDWQRFWLADRPVRLHPYVKNH